MLACRKHEGWLINTIIQLQHKSDRLKRMHFIKVVNELLLWSPGLGVIVCRSPGCLEWLLRESRVTLHTCKEERCVHPVQVKGSDDCFSSQPKKNAIFDLSKTKTLKYKFSFPIIMSFLLVSDVAGVVVPHQLSETLTPPRGEIQSHVEGVLSLGSWVPPAEPIPLNFGHFLWKYAAVYKLSHNLAGKCFKLNNRPSLWVHEQ